MCFVLIRIVPSSEAIAPAPWPVRLRGDAQTLLTGELDHRDDVGVGQREGDGGRPLVDGEVPCAPRLVPTGVVGPVDLAVEAAAEGFDVGGGAVGDQHAPIVSARAVRAHQGNPLKAAELAAAARRSRPPCR